jgi:hypothetical protein
MYDSDMHLNVFQGKTFSFGPAASRKTCAKYGLLKRRIQNYSTTANSSRIQEVLSPALPDKLPDSASAGDGK